MCISARHRAAVPSPHDHTTAVSLARPVYPCVPEGTVTALKTIPHRTSAYFNILIDCQLLILPTTLVNHTSHRLSPTVKSIAWTFIFGQAQSSVPGELGDSMADDRSRSRSRGRAGDSTELWFNMPSPDRRHEPEQSAYQATSNRHSMGSFVSTSSRTQLRIPTISTTSDLNKTLPLPPAEAEKKSRKPAALRSFLRGRSSSSHVDSSHLQPKPYACHQQRSSAGAHLSVDVHGHYQQQYSRSMPNSPYQQSYEAVQLYPPTPARVQSAIPDTTHYQPYSVRQDYPQRVNSPNAHFDPSPTRARTFPDSTVLSPTARNSVSSKPRPHTWLSPTEPFADPSQFHLFVEATTGLPNDADPWSPNGPNRLQGSLFARRSSNESTPTPFQYAPAPIPDRTQQTASWQSFEPPLTTSRSVSAPTSSVLHQDVFQRLPLHLTPHMNAVNAELEMLGLNDDQSSDDDELPNYAQSQAEMDARKREEAAARARDLEARWRDARGRRS